MQSDCLGDLVSDPGASGCPASTVPKARAMLVLLLHGRTVRFLQRQLANLAFTNTALFHLLLDVRLPEAHLPPIKDPGREPRTTFIGCNSCNACRDSRNPSVCEWRQAVGPI